MNQSSTMSQDHRDSVLGAIGPWASPECNGQLTTVRLKSEFDPPQATTDPSTGDMGPWHVFNPQEPSEASSYRPVTGSFVKELTGGPGLPIAAASDDRITSSIPGSTSAQCGTSIESDASCTVLGDSDADANNDEHDVNYRQDKKEVDDDSAAQGDTSQERGISTALTITEAGKSSTERTGPKL